MRQPHVSRAPWRQPAEPPAVNRLAEVLLSLAVLALVALAAVLWMAVGQP